MAKKITGPQVLTGNLLNDGMVVFLAGDGTWQARLEGARVARGEDGVVALETKADEAVRANLVVDPYLIEVEETTAGLVPAEFRERRRLAGPSIAFGFDARPGARAA